MPAIKSVSQTGSKPASKQAGRTPPGEPGEATKKHFVFLASPGFPGSLLARARDNQGTQPGTQQGKQVERARDTGRDTARETARGTARDTARATARHTARQIFLKMYPDRPEWVILPYIQGSE